MLDQWKKYMSADAHKQIESFIDFTQNSIPLRKYLLIT